MSKAQLIKRMAEIRKKVNAEKAAEKAGISKKDRNKFEALMAAERRFRALEKKGIDPADAKKYEGMTASDKKMFRDPDVLRDLGLKAGGVRAEKASKVTAGKIAKKVENKARKESSAVAKKASKEARKNLKDDLNYDKNVALKTKGAGAIGAAGVGGALYGRSKIKEAEKESEKRRANNKPTFEFKQLKKEPIKKKAGGAVGGIKKLLSKKRKAGKKETNPYKSTVGDSYATRSKKQGEIEQKILQNTSGRSSKKQKEMLKTLSERMKKERKETFDRRGMKAGGALKAPTNPGLKKLPTKVRNKMGYMKSGGKVTSKCKRDGIAIRGRTKGRMV